MTHSFQLHSGLILIQAEVSGPLDRVEAALVLDTGATTTILNRKLLEYIGYDPASSTDLVRVTTGSDVATAPRLMVNRLGALGRHAVGLRVLSHDLPPEAGVDGLLGLDFFRGLSLTIDFRAGQITLI